MLISWTTAPIRLIQMTRQGAGESPWPPDFNDNGQTDIGDLVILKWYWVGGGHSTCTVG